MKMEEKVMTGHQKNLNRWEILTAVNREEVGTWTLNVEILISNVVAGKFVRQC